MKTTRTAFFALIFDPQWTSDTFRYSIQEVQPVAEGESIDSKYSYSSCGKYKPYKEFCLITSKVHRLDIDSREVNPDEELQLLDGIEEGIVHAADVALQKTLDPIRARKTELAMLTHQPEHSFPGSDWLEPDPDDKEYHDSPSEE